ncbi:MAG: hypothetical protein DMF79_08895 [Acidobacteria bacterium]|nr:MAG: hypothetical protein DMF79_08895 [Acidobacteriota bacterium]
MSDGSPGDFVPRVPAWDMRVTFGIGAVACLGVFVAVAAGLSAPQGTSPRAQTGAADATARIVASAQAFLVTLDEAGKTKVQFPFDSPQKARWSNLPTGMFKREGLRLGDLTPAQRPAAMALLSTALSQEGYRKVVEIMRGDEVLRGPAGEPPRGGNVRFGEDEYYLAFLGVPSVSAPWMLQFGGHHLAINLTLAGRQATLAPSHTAAQPARYAFEGRTVRPLGDENDRAFALMATLDAAQRRQAILEYSVSDLVLGPGRDGRAIQPEGLKASALSASQQAMLLDLVREWAGIANDALAEPRMGEIRARLPETYFAWSGPTTEGSAAYFRIQGPTLVIEYAPQRGVDHIHTIYRDPTNDYGARFARE